MYRVPLMPSLSTQRVPLVHFLSRPVQESPSSEVATEEHLSLNPRKALSPGPKESQGGHLATLRMF